MATYTIEVDIAVIGAGTAGTHAFSTARRAGAKTVLIDQGPLGTTCARTGCMPSKAVLYAAHRWSTLQRLMPADSKQPLPTGHTTPQQLWQQALSIRDNLVQGNVRQIEKLGAQDLLQASAQFVGPHTLQLSDGRTVHARAFVVATGSDPVKPADLQAKLGNLLITSDDLFYFTDLPRSVAVMGAGAIGLEMSLALSHLGVDIALVGRSEKLAKVSDPVVAKAATQYFSEQLKMVLGAADITVERDGNHVVLQAGSLTHRAQYLLAALGRKPRLDALNVQTANVQFDGNGRPKMGMASQQCAGTQIFLAGDVGPGPALQHEAAYEGALAAQQALELLGFQGITPRTRMVPLAIVFSDPDIAEVGLRFNQLPEDVLIGTVEGEGSGRSKLMQAPHHVLRLYAASQTGQLIGASILSAGGEHLAHQLAWAIQRGETVQSMLELPYYHPTLEEMIDTALRDLRRQLRT